MYSVDGLPKHKGDYRFFELGNHFFRKISILGIVQFDVNDHLEMFVTYLTKYKNMLELEKPSGTDTSVYKDFDAYMTKLDPVAGYLAGKFGKIKQRVL